MKKYDVEYNMSINCEIGTDLYKNFVESGIMEYGVVCNHDPDYLCECRYHAIIEHKKEYDRLKKLERITK
jgi:hypothetical protein